MATERQKLKVFYAEGSVEADQTNTCLVCPKVIDLGGGRRGLLARTTETKAPTCAHCLCALGFAGCTNRPRRGPFVVAACAACVDGLRTRAASYAPTNGKLRNPIRGVVDCLALIEESNPQNLTKQPLHDSVRSFHGGSVRVAKDIYADAGKPGLAERVVTQLALQQRDPDIANALRVHPANQPRRIPTLSSRKGGGGLRGMDVGRGAGSCLPLDARSSCNLETAGDEPLADLDLVAEATLERYRCAVDKSKGKDADERLLLIYAMEAAEKLAATLAHAPRARTRRTAPRKADALAERILTRAKEKAALEASRSPGEVERLAEKRKKNALAAAGVSYAEQAGTDPHDGEATVENHRTKLDDQKKKARGRARRRREKARNESGLDPVQDAIKRKESSTAKRLAAHKRAKEDPDSGRWVVCKHEDCKLHGVKIMYHGASFKQCPFADGGCGRRMAFM